MQTNHHRRFKSRFSDLVDFRPVDGSPAQETRERRRFGPGGRAVREGKADVQFQCCPPNKGLTELTELANVRHVMLPQAQLDKVTKKTFDFATLPVREFMIRERRKLGEGHPAERD